MNIEYSPYMSLAAFMTVLRLSSDQHQMLVGGNIYQNSLHTLNRLRGQWSWSTGCPTPSVQGR